MAPGVRTHLWLRDAVVTNGITRALEPTASLRSRRLSAALARFRST